MYDELHDWVDPGSESVRAHAKQGESVGGRGRGKGVKLELLSTGSCHNWSGELLFVGRERANSRTQ